MIVMGKYPKRNKKEMGLMPRRDGTGPMGMGPMTGRRRGPCGVAKAAGTIGGLGLGLGLGLGRMRNVSSPQEEKELLKEEKAALENRLNQINDQLNDSQDEK